MHSHKYDTFCLLLRLFYFSVSLFRSTSMWWHSFYLIKFYFVMFCCYLLKASSFLMKARKGEKLDGRGGWEELGAVEGMEAVFRLYCMTEESMVNWSGSRKDPYQKIPFNYTCIFTHSLHKFHPPFPFPLDNHILIAHPRSSTATKSIKFPHPSEILTFILVLSSTPKLFLSMDYSLLIIYLMANIQILVNTDHIYLSGQGYHIQDYYFLFSLTFGSFHDAIFF